MKKISFLLFILFSYTAYAQNTLSGNNPIAKTANGTLQGITDSTGIKMFRGIPFAQPPVGDLRWKNPLPPKNWKGVHKADKFGHQAMQGAVFSDMVFRSAGNSEDCLYLNVWTPAKTTGEKLPVLVYFYGGGFVAGDGSEPRYDGESMAQKGIVSITVNYRLGVFGFLAHPELTKESPYHASGNYGLMDQHAALVWVQKNIAAFGGDPNKVTIDGESAGSMSVSAQMASPLSKGLFRAAIAESGSLLGSILPKSLAEAELNGVKFAAAVGASSLADLRKLPADSLLKLSAKARFPTTVDGHFLPEFPQAIFSTGRQMDVPLLAGWNSAEMNYHPLLGKDTPTLVNYKNALKKLYADKADDVLKFYPAATDADVPQAATDLASDRFIAYATWKFIDLHAKTDGKYVYRYLFSRKRPPMVNDPNSGANSLGAAHASEIAYALGNLHYDKVYAWTPDDYKASETMENYFANFIKTGDPNGEGLPKWYALQASKPKIMVIDVNSHSEPEKNLRRYVFMDSFYNK